jgi:2-dehydro-3-deoxy-D-arabinonate dehydratase
MAFWVIDVDGTRRLARGPAETGPRELLPATITIDTLLATPGAFPGAVETAAEGPVPDGAHVRAPVANQDVWAAGVTYLRSRDARMHESDAPDVYDRVYNADRPELFFKASPGRAVGPGDDVGVRADSGWDVPEPELGLILDASGTIVGYTIGNDVSSRSIEGENALYLPQAKVFDASCALGPCLVPIAEAPAPAGMRITMEVRRGRSTIYSDEVNVSDMKRTPEELAGWLFKAQSFPVGAVLLTGTAIVPSDDFTLTPGDEVEISITGLGTLTNGVKLVGGA